MRVVVQRVAEAAVRVEGEVVGEIGPGFMILFCAAAGDTDADAAFLARKIAALRIFTDDAGKMNLSLKDTGGSALVVSQFTLAAQWRNGNRPGVSLAAPPRRGRTPLPSFPRPAGGGGHSGGDRRLRRGDGGLPGQPGAGDDPDGHPRPALKDASSLGHGSHYPSRYLE